MQTSQNLALNNAVNLQKSLGQDNVAIEIVAYGPGLSLLTDQSSQMKGRESCHAGYNIQCMREYNETHV